MSTFLCVNCRLISCFCFVLFSEPVVEVIDKEVKTEQAQEEKKDTKCDGDKQEVKGDQEVKPVTSGKRQAEEPAE
jgi:hypothetical protein